MSIFAVLLVCIQACLAQNVLSQCSSIAPSACGAALAPAAAYAPLAYTPSSIACAPATAAYSPTTAFGAAYGGAGEGNVAVTGELPIGGNAAMAGQVPITGIMSFGGALPAAGAVSITGNCACGCSSIY